MFKNSVLNIAGGIVPALIAVPALGYLARELSAPLLGVFMLILALVGYGGIFDAGLGRAVVRHVSLNAARPSVHGVVLGTALAFVAVSGITIAVSIFVLADSLAEALLGLSKDVIGEGRHGLRIAAWSIPVLLLAVILQSYLEGLERFTVFNVYRTLSGSATYLFPVLAFQVFGTTFSALMWGFFLAKVCALVIVIAVVAKHCPWRRWRFDAALLMQLLRFGGWLTVTNVVSPFMVYMDRLVISRLIGAASVAVYAAPAELINRMSFLPGAVSRALFPRLISLTGKQGAIHDVKRSAYAYMVVLTAPVAITLIAAADVIVRIWLGESFVPASSLVIQILALGFFVNCLAFVPYSSLQARGLSRLTAMIHLVEIVPYIACLIAATRAFGIQGSAAVWTARMVIDFVLMWLLDRRTEPAR